MTTEQIKHLKKFNKGFKRRVLVFDNNLDFIVDGNNYILKSSKIIPFEYRTLSTRYLESIQVYENLFEIVDRPEYFIYA